VNKGKCIQIVIKQNKDSGKGKHLVTEGFLHGAACAQKDTT
jgi:hypothetical protein